MSFSNDERTLLTLYYEEDRQTTLHNLFAMLKELPSDERMLCELTVSAISKLSAMTDEEFQKLDLFGEAR